MLSYFANPERFNKFAHTASPILAALAVILAVIGLPLALVFSPQDYQQDHLVRIMYIHVPAAWTAMGAYTFISIASAIAFVWRHNLADLAARAAAPIGLAMTILTLVTGAIWGKPSWGAWRVWDARLTSVLVLMFIYCGYLAIWDAMDDKKKAAKFARIFALVGFINIPIIKFSVDWWTSLHQPASIIRVDGPSVTASILTPLLIMIAAYTAFFAWYVLTGVQGQLRANRARREQKHPVSRPVIISQGETDDG